VLLRFNELPLREVERQLLNRHGIVMRQGMIQIESDRVDFGEPEVSIHEHSVPPWNPVLAVAQGSYGGFLLRGDGALRSGHSGIVGDLTTLRPLSTVPGWSCVATRIPEPLPAAP